MNILIINGPNLNLLGKRDKNQYGDLTLEKINHIIETTFVEIHFGFFQSNIEGEIIDRIQTSPQQYDAIVINPAGYSHTSVAIRDALEIIKIPKIEVHLSNIYSRESFREKSITGSVCDGVITGLRETSYLAAIYSIKTLVIRKTMSAIT
ncbi:MAG: type II 3-dehydroquinate dehydratase [Ignavibacteriales bacterium]|nr:type II 3-dehydroquinate dehydratase [Ignavibacteriales bacterium]